LPAGFWRCIGARGSSAFCCPPGGSPGPCRGWPWAPGGIPCGFGCMPWPDWPIPPAGWKPCGPGRPPPG
jgi:hypothetical protein